MKKILSILPSILVFFCTGFAQVGIGTTTPNASAQLDVFNTNKGFLPPRVALNATNVPVPVNNPATGLLVFNTAVAGSGASAVSPGYYFWNGTAWYPLASKGNAPGEMQYWDGSRWVTIPAGVNGQALTFCNGVPTWGPCVNSNLILKPTSNFYDGFIDSRYPNGWLDQDGQINLAAWTVGGLQVNQRSFLKFDFSGIPANATVDSAKLILYAMPNPLYGNQTEAHSGMVNACYVRRIASTWMLPTTFSWSSQPTVSVANQAVIPQSTAAFENSVIDVTGLVKDMQINGNNGFAFGLQSETVNNIRQYASSDYSDASKHPTLIISYH